MNKTGLVFCRKDKFVKNIGRHEVWEGEFKHLEDNLKWRFCKFNHDGEAVALGMRYDAFDNMNEDDLI